MPNRTFEKNSIINVGIAGFGYSARVFHAPFLVCNPHFVLSKVLERHSEMSKAIYPQVEVVRSFENLLCEDVDMVVICTPNPAHVPMARLAMEAGKHVVIEKPVAATADEANELIGLAEAHGVGLFVYQNRRFDGDFLTVRHLVEGDVLGEIVSYESRYDRYVLGASSKVWKARGGRGVNILYDLGVHLIDQACCLFGRPKEVYADFRKLRPCTPEFDEFGLILYYEGLKVVLGASEVAAMPGPRYVVHGRNGSFVKFGMDPQEAALKRGENPSSPNWGSDNPDNYGLLARIIRDEVVPKRLPTMPGDYGAFYDNVADVLINCATPAIDPLDSVHVLEVIEIAMLSASTGKKEQIMMR